MPQVTSTFRMFPWTGGVNTALDPAIIPANQLTVAKNCIFSTRGSRKKRDSINHNWDTGTTSTDSIIGLHDFWFGSTTKTQRLMAVTSGKAIYSHSSATRSADLFGGTAWGSAVTTASMTTINNLCVIAVDGTNNVMKSWGGSGSVIDLAGTPPVASIVGQHLGRLWCNDKTNNDRIHYSTTANPNEWNGVGDSGAIDVGVGDGDPDGVTAFYSFKGLLFVWKRTKLYKIVGDTPESFQVILISAGIGCSSHNAVVAIEMDDLFFVSEKGIHSLGATDAYGDFEANYVSVDIQKTFNEKFSKARLPYCRAAYLSNINSVAFAFNDTTISSNLNNTIWLYNIPQKAWYEWPNVSCQSLITVRDADKARFYLGTNVTRISKTFHGTNYDVSNAGVNTGISFRTTTGNILVDEDPYTVKAFKRFSLFHQPVSGSQITVLIKIDNHTVQSLSFTSPGGSDLLGSTFILGQSVLGSSEILAPYTQSIDGYGRSIQITIEQTGTNQAVEISGFAIEYELAGSQQEIIS